MRTAFIIFAIFAAVVLLIRFAAPAAMPRFYRAERITQKALIDNITALGKRCAVTEYGQGIQYGSIKIRSVIDACKRRVRVGAADDWQYMLDSGNNTILRAFSDAKSAARYSAYCGHVGKYPRIFLFCERVIRDSGCELTRDLLFDAISAFEKNARFTQSERKILCGMLKLCLIGYLYLSAVCARKHAEKYDLGVVDGENGRVDLDYLNDDDYVCGLVRTCSQFERSAVLRLLDHNGIDIDSADSRRRKRLAQAYVTVNSVLRSLAIVNDCESAVYTHKTHDSERVKRYVKAFNITFPILLAVYAVFTCVFASSKYVALFSVASIITYAVMRIPMLLYSPTIGINIFSPIEALLLRKSLSGDNKVPHGNNRLFLSEAAYFGSEPQYIESVIDGEKISVVCNNRGDITIKSNSNCDRIYVRVQSDETSIVLSECDGVIEPHRVIYRACKGDLELCAETVAPIDGNACVVRITMINRCDCDKTFALTGAIVRRQPELQKCITENIRGGAMAVCDNGFALALNGGSYGGDLYAFCADGTLRHGSFDAPALIGRAELKVTRFSRAVSYMTVIYASSRVLAENIIEYAADRLYYARATESACIYCKPNASKLPSTQYLSFPSRRLTGAAVFASPVLPKHLCDYQLPFGGISREHLTIADSGLCKPINNTVVGGDLCIELNQFGIQDISVGQERLTASVDKYTHTPRAFVIIGEDGVMWSPTVKPVGGGHMRTIHGRGYTEYVCAYNGAVCVQKCFAAIGLSAAFIDITLYNKTNTARRFDIMFSAVCNSDIDVALGNMGVTAKTKKNKLSLYAIGSAAEYAAYKEAYYVYGNIDRTSEFRVGGSTPAPTAAVSCTVNADDGVRIVFCIADEALVDKLSKLSDVDELFCGIERFYERLGRILPKTDDGVLNLSYMRSLYSAYCAFAARTAMPLYAQCLLFSAAKYVDPMAVNNRIYRILCGQNQNGLLGGDYYDCLQAVRCVIEYAEYARDAEFWNEVLPYAGCRAYGKRAVINDTAADHIVRAVEYLITSPIPTAKSAVQNTWQYKNLIYALRFAENKINVDSKLYVQYKKRFAEAVERYSLEVKHLTANNFFQFQSTTEAYICARILFDLELNEKAYNIIKFNNPVERCLHYGKRSDEGTFDYFFDPVAAAVYFSTVTERLFGVKFRGKTLKIYPHLSTNMPQVMFDIFGKNKDVSIIVDGTKQCGNWRMRVNKINYPADSVDIRNLSDNIVFYRDGSE